MVRWKGSSTAYVTTFKLFFTADFTRYLAPKVLKMKIQDEGIQVHRMPSGLDGKTRTLIEVFNLAENEKFPEVDSEEFI